MRAAKPDVPRNARRSLAGGWGAIAPSGGDWRLETLGLAEFAQDDAALQRRDMVDEQHAVEMVDLVLDAGGEQALGFELADLVLLVEIAQADGRRPLDIGILLGQRQAAFAAYHRLVGLPDDFGVGQLDWLRLLALARAIDDDDAFEDTDLRRRQADAIRVVHCLKHVGHQLAHAPVDLGDWLGLAFEPRIGRG